MRSQPSLRDSKTTSSRASGSCPSRPGGRWPAMVRCRKLRPSRLQGSEGPGDREGDKVLEAIFALVSRDEAAHAGFYRAMARIELEADRPALFRTSPRRCAVPDAGRRADCAYQERLRDSGAGISARHFVEHALFPTLKMLGTNRAELKAVAEPMQLRSRTTCWPPPASENHPLSSAGCTSAKEPKLLECKAARADI